MDINILLKRTNLKIGFNEFTGIIESNYPDIGKILSFEPIFEGYEDANIILNCQNGKFVLKIFGNFRSARNISDYAIVIREATKLNVPTLEVVSSQQGDICKHQDTNFLITRFFPGESFNHTTPTLDEMLIIAGSIAKLNTLQIKVEESYDSWGNKNLIQEFKRAKLNNSVILDSITPLIDLIQKLDTSKFSKGLIHGDMQRKHVLKNGTQLCIIDFGCMSYDLVVYDLSTYLAWFCLAEDTWKSRNQIFEQVVSQYCKNKLLTTNEINSLKILVTASYAAYYLETTKLIEGGDKLLETKTWHDQAQNLFFKSLAWLKQ